MKFYKKIFLVLLFFSIFQNINAKERFIIDDIVLKGLQRVDRGSIYSYLPFEVGDIFDTSMTPSVIKTLFKSKFFNDIVIERKGNSLIIIFDERPTIVDINFEGLDGIEDEQLNKILDAANIASGRIYDSSVLERIKSELREQSFARGMYSVDIDIEEKILFSIIAWITFLYLIVKKSYYGIKDIAAANMTIGGLIFLLLAYLGTKLLIN